MWKRIMWVLATTVLLHTAAADTRQENDQWQKARRLEITSGDPEGAMQIYNELATNPEQALASAGITPTPEMLDALKGVDATAVQRLAASFGEEKAAG